MPLSSPPLQDLRIGAAQANPQESAQINRLLDSGVFWLRFPALLEARFQRHCAARRSRALFYNGILASIAFNWLLFSDWLLVPDAFGLALKLRLLVYTPLTFIGMIMVPRFATNAVREWIPSVWGVGACAISLAICLSSQDPYAGAYLVGIVPILVFANSVARMRFMPALWMNGALLAMYGAGAVSFPNAPVAVIVPATLVVFSSIVFTLYGCYTLERDERYNWLLRLRERALLHELEQANSRLDAISRSDILTDVANRRHFDSYLQQVWAQAKEDGSDISLMMIDMDHFKAYNERYGHPEGDVCLQEVAVTLKRLLRRPGDLIARYAGEEFIVVLKGAPLTTAASAAERARKGVELMNRPHATSPTHSAVTVSIGVACLRPNAPHASTAQLISAASEALHQAKSHGCNRVFAFGTNHEGAQA
ncbi:MAG: diguanylate cyclase [Aquabacterium sp.]|nr:diguanylate cyclase [Aquabacterium sp.]